MTVSVKLEYPIKLDVGVIDEVNLRRPKVRDMAAFETAMVEGRLRGTVVMLASISGLTVEQVEEMDAGDFARVSDAMAPLMPGTQRPLPVGE